MVPLVYSIVFLTFGIVLLKLYFKWTSGYCKSKARLDGKLAIVTGANTGIGFETAQDLARRGAKVILACRSKDTAQEAAETIRKITGNGNVVAKTLDLSSLKSVREFCHQVLKEEDRLDILVNNAAVAGIINKTVDEDGMELCFTTNHFGPFLLTNILLGLMKKSKTGRIVNVSSLAHKWIDNLDLDNLNSEKLWDPITVYARTKLANILFTKELSRRLRKSGLNGILVNCANPGWVRTSMFRHLKSYRKLGILVSQFFFKSPYEGSQPSIDLCLGEINQSGLYWTDCKIETPSKLAQDEKLGKALWERSAKIVGLSSHECHLL